MIQREFALIPRLRFRGVYLGGRAALRVLPMVIVLGAFIVDPAYADVESECRSVIQEVRANITNRHGIRPVQVQRLTSAERGYEAQRNSQGEVFSRVYDIVLPNTPSQLNRSLEFLSSPVLMRSYAQLISNRCRPVLVIDFGLDGSDQRARYMLNEQGKME